MLPGLRRRVACCSAAGDPARRCAMRQSRRRARVRSSVHIPLPRGLRFLYPPPIEFALAHRVVTHESTAPLLRLRGRGGVRSASNSCPIPRKAICPGVEGEPLFQYKHQRLKLLRWTERDDHDAPGGNRSGAAGSEFAPDGASPYWRLPYCCDHRLSSRKPLRSRRRRKQRPSSPR
jgi:hypothetical protein